ncbi:MAG: TldD/PmbA family protein [Candidatus Woesearchaeota archaeon]
MQEELLKELTKLGASNIVITKNSEKATHVKFANSQIATTKSWELAKYSVFVEQGKKIITTTLEKVDNPSETAKFLMSLLKQTEPNPDFEAIAKGPFKYKTGLHYDSSAKNTDPALLVEKAIDAANELDKRRCAGVIEVAETTSELVTSNGVNAEDRGTGFYCSFRAMGPITSGHEVEVSRHFKTFKYIEAAKRAAETASGKETKSVSPGKFDVLFSPLAFANIVGRVADATGVFSVEAGLSCFGNKVGEKFGNLTIHDDSTLIDGFRSRAFDDEGIPAQKTTVFDKGVLKTFLHNTSSAKRYKTKTTGNAGLIAPYSTNTVVEAGKVSDEKLMSDFTGLYITNLWYTRFQNYATGDFSTIPRDALYYVKNGEMQHIVKDTRISDNLIEMMRKTSTLSKDARQIRGWEVDMPVITPMAIVKDVNITKSTE